MPIEDIWIVFRWWGALFLVGAAATPLTKRLFASWHDEGYLFSKAVGMATVTWIVYVLGMARVPFGVGTIVAAVGAVFVFGVFLSKSLTSPKELKSLKWGTILTEELFFLAALLFWSWIKAHEPSIRGLEKFMDYGFMQSILNSRYFPPVDMWYPPFPINYYYFGHMVTALLTKLSGLDLAYTFNLMLATIFAFTFTMSFSIGYELSVISRQSSDSLKTKSRRLKAVFGGLLTAFLVTLAGNMQTIYVFTKGYSGDDVKPFWELMWNWRELWEIGGIGEIWGKLGEGMNIYWYANATRFIPWTIHEFPSYSFVVSDVHGHVLSIPFVLLAIGLLIDIFKSRSDTGYKGYWGEYIFYGFLCGVLLMTNALDGPVYIALLIGVLVISNIKYSNNPIIQSWKHIATKIAVVFGAVFVTSSPFLSHFKSFVNGIAVNCPLPFLANSKVGPIIFEGVEKCQRSPLWMMWLLWGFFIYCGVTLFLKKKFTPIEKTLLLFFGFSILLIIFPEFFYFKDIYPQHFRSNTMFKLGYEAFILFSIVSGYVIVQVLSIGRENFGGKHQVLNSKFKINPKRQLSVFKTIFVILLVPQFFLVSIYPLFSVRSYFGALKNYEGLYGFTWLAREYPENYQAMLWLKDQPYGAIVEADGDSYTDYEQFSVFTGKPTIVGWAVHEWLWRGSYDVVSPRREEVRKVYESEDVTETKQILEHYNVRYIIVGSLEREKFTSLFEDKFERLGTRIYQHGGMVIYEVDH